MSQKEPDGRGHWDQHLTTTQQAAVVTSPVVMTSREVATGRAAALAVVGSSIEPATNQEAARAVVTTVVTVAGVVTALRSVMKTLTTDNDQLPSPQAPDVCQQST